MLIGQMSIPKVSEKANYLQLDVCGLSVEKAIDRFLKYNTELPVIIHGDWTKKGASENNLTQRVDDYIEIINKLKEMTTVYGITIHPPTRKTMSLDEMISICNKIKEDTNINVFVENRSNSRIWLSNIEEIIEFSKNYLMTIDIPQLYISCGYNQDLLIDTLKKINMENVSEIHLANILKKEKNTFVARKLNDGDLDLDKIIPLLNKKAFYTLEILGGLPTFESQKNILENTFNNYSN